MKLEVTHKNRLKGKIRISGSKNASLPLMVCSLLTSDEIILHNVPDIIDTKNMMLLLEEVGVKVNYNAKKEILKLKTISINPNLKNNLMKRLRASYYIMGALVGNHLSFDSYYPGGCTFMDRPIDYHLDAFTKMGYEITIKEEVIDFVFKNSTDDKTVIKLKKQSVGTTINIILASVKKQYITIIENASTEPEVLQVMEMLNKMGAFITLKEHTILIKGVERLHKVEYNVMSDRIEAGSYMMLASSLPKSKVKLTNVDTSVLTKVLDVLIRMNISIKIKQDSVIIKRLDEINKIDVYVDVYPAFPTDLQQILTVLCTTANDTSTIIDNIYISRFSQVLELKKANALVEVIENKITIQPCQLNNTTLVATDLRCGFACILMAVLMNGKVIIKKAENILRGYEKLIDKMKKIGINIIIIE